MTLVSDDANEIFGGCQPFDNDWSLDALVRAIVMKYSEWSFETIAERVSTNKIRVRSREDMDSALRNHTEAVLVVECINCFDEAVTCYEGWKAEFTFNGKPFPVNQYLSQYCRTKIYINEELKRIVAFVDRRANHVWVQAFESVICRLMPWYFPLDLSDEEKAFYKSIAVDNKAVKPEEAAEILVNFVNTVAQQIDFRALKLHRMLDGIADRSRQSRMRDLRSSITSTGRDIQSYRNTLADLYSRLDSYNLELNGLEALPPEKDDAMFTFFNNHKQLTILDVMDSELRFGVEDTLEFYDEDEFVRVFKGGRSYLSNHHPKVRKALWAIFKERRGVIRIQATFKLRNFKLVEPMSRNTFVKNCMPNPHIYYHACSGGNETYYYQYAESGDWDLAIEQAIAATKNLNWGDSTVCSEMVSWLTNNECTPCIYVADGLKPIDGVDKGMKLMSFHDFMGAVELLEGETANG